MSVSEKSVCGVCVCVCGGVGPQTPTPPPTRCYVPAIENVRSYTSNSKINTELNF